MKNKPQNNNHKKETYNKSFQQQSATIRNCNERCHTKRASGWFVYISLLVIDRDNNR